MRRRIWICLMLFSRVAWAQHPGDMQAQPLRTDDLPSDVATVKVVGTSFQDLMVGQPVQLLEITGGEKKKIAESIIIRVGGGIRAVNREPVASQDALNATNADAVYEQTDDIHSLSSEIVSTAKDDSDKIIN